MCSFVRARERDHFVVCVKTKIVIQIGLQQWCIMSKRVCVCACVLQASVNYHGSKAAVQPNLQGSNLAWSVAELLRKDCILLLAMHSNTSNISFSVLFVVLSNTHLYEQTQWK